MDAKAAHTVFQDWLDRVAAYVVANDYDNWRTTMSCPVVVNSAAGPSEMGTEDQLREKFEQWRLQINVQRVSDLIRIAHDVQAISEDHIEGAYTMDVLSNGQRVMPRFISAATLRYQDRHWRATELNSGLAVKHRHLIHTSAPDDDTTVAPPPTAEGNTP
ncbi:hypothetical protein [Loktanella sp. M215]|uniref:hypothetical protein n=1 Tax=Loktanella sp. M215 TaxID=2675431 RepID=UPI001F2789EB|nr:hypothetical protein [Loktanella sp. M215]MCF7701046.1 hypothetical protein [Loktanella sp. M215]